MQEPTNETPQEEVKNPNIEWELVHDSDRLRELLRNTFKDVIKQSLADASGSAELAAADGPRFERDRKKNSVAAQDATKITIRQVEELEEILSRPHNQIPVDTRYRDKNNPGDHSNDYIYLKSDTKNTPQQPTQMAKTPPKS